jgi:nucleotide-binding universal stress UspA family protein
VGDIVIGMDMSDGAAAALRWGLREADLREHEPTAVMAWGLLDQHQGDPDAAFDPSYDEVDAVTALGIAIQRAVGTDGAAAIQRRAVCDLPARALLDAAEGAELLVVGSRGLGGFRGLLVGSISDQCLRHATCPVAVVKPSPPPDGGAAGAGDRGPGGGDTGRPERVVVGIDGSENARQALRWALDEGRARGATVVVVHAWLPHATNMGWPTALAAEAGTPDEAAALVEATLDEEDTTGLPGPVVRQVVCDRAAGAILVAAEDADVVVVGARGLGGFRRLLLGSVSQQVTHHAPCPVVVLPPATRPSAADRPP